MSNNRTSAIIVDDEKALRLHLRRLLSDVWPELEILGEAADGKTTLRMIKNKRPDIVFLDIRMPGLDGIEVAAQINDPCRIVFVTAYEEYAVAAFEQAAIDYLLKPLTAERLAETVKRLRSQCSDDPPDLSQLLAQLKRSETPRYLEWIKAAHRDEIKLLSVEEIDFFQAKDKYTNLFSGNQEWLIRRSLKDLERELNPDQFWRIHRATPGRRHRKRPQ